MEKREDHIMIKSNFINALLPDFLKHLFYNSAFLFILFLIYIVLDKVMNFQNDFEIIFYLIFLTIFISLIMLVKDFVRIYFTEFRFYSNHVEYRYKSISEETHSINYNKITDIEVRKSIWDVICGVGDVILHTANDNLSDDEKHLILKDIKNPNHIKEEIAKKVNLR